MKAATRTTFITAAALALTAAGLLFAGPLNPPAGPITSTNKTLTEVEPRIAINATNTPGDANSLFKITQPGSYYLTGNITGVAAEHGIEITASGVTLDLMGFDLLGVASSLDGVSATVGFLRNTTIRNGSVRNWGNAGVMIISATGNTGQRVESVAANGNGGTGISCSGDTGTVIDSTATANGGNGISARFIQRCIARENAGIGLAVSQGGSILQSVALYNGGDGLHTGFACTVTDSSSCYNGGDGITSSNGSTITNCTFSGNTGSGMDVFSSISIHNCTAVGNLLHGINTDSNCVIEGCLANSNTFDGIRCGSDSTVRGNTANSNGTGAETGAGIHATGNGARVEGNTCNNNEIGIDVDGGDNIVIKNTCSDNILAFVIAANNFYGPIIDRRIPTTVASTPVVAGFAATGTMGSTDSNANFAH